MFTTPGLYRVILTHVKTAISLPDDLFERATRRAGELGISRSQLFATAAQRYLDHLDESSVTARIDQVLEATDDDSSVAAVRAGRRRLAQDEW
jgi:metal-responsive CopG/Arc/MetJ family transcriptional regulator